MTEIKKVAIIGAGLMGHGLAQIFAGCGFETSMTDVDPGMFEKALAGIRSNLTMMADKGVGSLDKIEPTLSRISTTTDLAEAADGAGIVIEAVVEKLEVKQSIFRQLDEICPPETVLASNTSVISITEIASAAKNRARVVGTHFWNPPYLIPLVEVVKGDETEMWAVDKTYDFMAKAGKKPVKVMKDVPGFVGNRLQHALWREAVSIVEHGIADAATVDDVIKNSFGLRLPVLAPLENADLVGLDLTLQIHDYILKHIEASPAPSPLLVEKVKAGELGFKSGGRGFRNWTEEQQKELRTKLQEYLLATLK